MAHVVNGVDRKVMKPDRLQPKQIVPVEIEIWPSSTLFCAGEAMRLVVMGADPIAPSDMPGVEISRHPDSLNPPPPQPTQTAERGHS